MLKEKYDCKTITDAAERVVFKKLFVFSVQCVIPDEEAVHRQKKAHGGSARKYTHFRAENTRE